MFHRAHVGNRPTNYFFFGLAGFALGLGCGCGGVESIRRSTSSGVGGFFCGSLLMAFSHG